MNYRHAYHAGNIGDVLKHAVLARLIVYFQRKDKAFRILDTHAGIGLYDLASEETRKTGEWQQGVAKVLSAEIPPHVETLLAPWLGVVRDLNPGPELDVYPGSPQVARQLMRKIDRLTLTELHPQDFRTLSERYTGDHQVKTIHLDGWLAMGSFLPPKEKRGFVLIDPAFRGHGRVRPHDRGGPQGPQEMAWRHLCPVVPAEGRARDPQDARGLRRCGPQGRSFAELTVGRSGPDTRMLGSGMTLVNPPYTLADEMRDVLPWLADVLHQGPGAGWSVTQVIGE